MFNATTFKSSIEVIGYVPHEKSISYLLVSHALLLIVDEAKESEEIVPGKVYEYIGSMKPVIAIAPAKKKRLTTLKKLPEKGDISALALISRYLRKN